MGQSGQQQAADSQRRPGLIKDAAGVEGMRAAGRAAASVLEMIAERVKAGVSTGELNDIFHQYITKTLNCIPAPRLLSGYKTPKHIEFIDELPKSAAGKILHRQLGRAKK